MFYCEITDILKKVLSSVKCQSCINNLKAVDGEEMTANYLFSLKQSALHPKCLQPSHSAWKLFLRLEFIFKGLIPRISPDDEKFPDYFMNSANRILIPDEHCFTTTAKIMSAFIKARIKLKVHQYLPHKRLKHASPSLVV